jgi:hypothetical protein
MQPNQEMRDTRPGRAAELSSRPERAKAPLRVGTGPANPRYGPDIGLVALVARGSVGEVVADYIRQRVFFGGLRDGERVPQRAIAEALGVSSAPVREALAALQREGVVTIELNPGAFVNGLDALRFRDREPS